MGECPDCSVSPIAGDICNDHIKIHDEVFIAQGRKIFQWIYETAKHNDTLVVYKEDDCFGLKNLDNNKQYLMNKEDIKRMLGEFNLNNVIEIISIFYWIISNISFCYLRISNSTLYTIFFSSIRRLLNSRSIKISQS